MPAPATALIAQWEPRPVSTIRVVKDRSTSVLPFTPPPLRMEFIAYVQFSTAWKPSPVNAPRKNPSSGPRTSCRAPRAISATPDSLRSSSLSGAVSAAAQREPNSMPLVFDQMPWRPVLATIAQPVAAVAPQATPLQAHGRGGGRNGRTRLRTATPAPTVIRSSTKASSAAPGNTRTTAANSKTISPAPRTHRAPHNQPIGHRPQEPRTTAYAEGATDRVMASPAGRRHRGPWPWRRPVRADPFPVSPVR